MPYICKIRSDIDDGVLQVLDLFTTYFCLSRKKGHEANPFMAWVFARLGAIPGLIATKGALIAALLYGGESLPVALLYALTAGYFYVVVNNFRVLKNG